MKRLLIIFLFSAFCVSAQKIGADVIKFDSITSTVRNGYNVPYGERWLIWNGTTGEFEYSNGDDVWTTLGGGSIAWGDITGTLSSQTDLQSALNLKANDNVVVKLTGTQSITGSKNFNYLSSSETEIFKLYLGASVGENTRRWLVEKTNGHLYFNYQNTNSTSISGSYTDLYRLNTTGIPVDPIDLTPKSYVDTAISGAVTDNQTATEVPFTPYLTIGSTNTQAAVQELKDELDAAVLGGGGLTAEQANRIENIEKIKSFIKTADFLWSPSDVTTSTGTTDNAKGSIVTNQTGTSIEGEMQDADVCEGCKIRVRNIGAASEIVNYFADGETGLFRNLAGTTGNEWTVGGSSQFLGTKEAGVITVDGGTVATRVFVPPAIYNGQNAADPVNEVNGINGITSRATDFLITSSNAISPQNGTRYVRLVQNLGNNLEARSYLQLIGVNSGDDVSVSIWFYEEVGTNWAFNTRTALGWQTLASQNITAVGNWVQHTIGGIATINNPQIEIQGTAGASDLNDILNYDNVVITVN
jgi:hypothetical protein